MWEKNSNWLPPAHAPTGDWPRNLGMCPDRELNGPPFGAQEDAPTKGATPARVWYVRCSPSPAHFLIEAAAFPRSPDFFHWSMALEAKTEGLGKPPAAAEPAFLGPSAEAARR